MEIQIADDIQKSVSNILGSLSIPYIDEKRIICIRSHKSKSRANARIWSFPRIWQLALNTGPHYVIEILSERFDRLSVDDKKRVLIHEIMHIPKTFSGALVPHRGRHHRIDRNSVEKLFAVYKNNLRARQA